TSQPAMHISARAANMELSLMSKKLLFGTSFAQAFTDQTQPGFGNSSLITERVVNQPEVYLDLNSGEFEGFVEWSENRTHVNQLLSTPLDTNHTGDALYASLSYATKDFGI